MIFFRSSFERSLGFIHRIESKREELCDEKNAGGFKFLFGFGFSGSFICFQAVCSKGY